MTAAFWSTFGPALGEGLRHIAGGWDHLLFLLALLLPSVLVRDGRHWTSVPRLLPAAIEVGWVILAFTAAHSLTMTLSMLGWVSLPARLVEPLIAASVVLAAAGNLRGQAMQGRWIVAGVFGLVHGFGFADGLMQLPLAPGTLLPALAGFDLGVALGQLAIAALFLPAAFALRATTLYRRGVLQLGSAAVAVLAAWWFAQRLLGL